MSAQGRRSSILNIDNWLDKCSNDEPDSVIYDADYVNDLALLKTKQKAAELEPLYRAVADLCTKIGLSSALVEERLLDIDQCITAYVETLHKDVQDEYDKLCQYKDDLLRQIQKMLSDLYLPAYIPEDDLTLLQHCKRLKNKHSELNVVKEKRMTRLQELRDKQTRHCVILGIKPSSVKTQTDIPTEDELNKLALAVADLEKEEKRRREKFATLKDMITKSMDQLEYEPQNEFERNILDMKPDFSEQNLKQMSALHLRLEAENIKNQEKYDKLKERLISLFDRLDVDQEERRKFFDNYSTCKPSLVAGMEVEIERYEELKRQNIGKFIEKIKDELAVEYERAYVSQEEQDQFFSLPVSEELLELYERELERIKKYYAENNEILEKFAKWRRMWKELIELEMKASDPNRFNNRGGQLLIEEKKRKTLQKNLPKIEEELSALNVKFHKATGNKFKVFNVDMDEFVSGCWDELNTAKEEEKRERQRAKMTTENKTRKPTATSNSRQAQVIIPRKTPTKRPPSTSISATPSKVQCQRSILGTPSSSLHRLNQLTGFSGSVKKSTQKPSRPIINGNTGNTNKSRTTKQSSGIPKIQIVSRPATSSNGSEASVMSLSEREFEELILSCPASAKAAK